MSRAWSWSRPSGRFSATSRLSSACAQSASSFASSASDVFVPLNASSSFSSIVSWLAPGTTTRLASISFSSSFARDSVRNSSSSNRSPTGSASPAQWYSPSRL